MEHETMFSAINEYYNQMHRTNLCDIVNIKLA